MTHLAVENPPLNAPSVVASLYLSLVALALPAVPQEFFPDQGSTIGVTFQFDNGSAIAEPLPGPLDYTLDSPDSVPQVLRDFAARNYERRNRWA